MNGAHAPHRVWIVPAVGFAATAIAVAAVPAILIPPDHRSEHFWGRVLWTEWLAFLVWGYFAALVAPIVAGPARRWRAGGVSPGIGLTVATYAVLSFAIMMASVAAPHTDTAARVHLAAQIAVGVAALLTCLVLSFSQAAAQPDAEAVPPDRLSPPQLAALLRAQEARLTECLGRGACAGASGLRDRLKRLREELTYSVPHVGGAVQSPDYAALEEGVRELCDTVSPIDPEAHEADRAMAAAAARAEALLRQVDLVTS